MKKLMLDELLRVASIIPKDPSATAVIIQVVDGDLPTFLPARRASAQQDSITIEVDYSKRKKVTRGKWSHGQ